MKQIFSTKSLLTWNLLLGLFVCSLVFTACKDDDNSASTPITITKVYLEDADASVTDREVEFARLGQIIRLEGSGFVGLKRVYINGYNTYFSPIYVTDNSMMVQVSNDTPTTEADPEARNTIRLVKEGAEKTFDFIIRAAAPSITSISNTMPKVGEPIIVYGKGLTEIESVTFPGGVVVNSGIISDVDGKYFMLNMPEGVSVDGGSILAVGSNGGAYSPGYFNYKKGMILDFDGLGSQGFWGTSESMIADSDLESAAIGEGNTSQGTYCAHRPTRIASFGAGKNRCSEVWTAGNGVDDWTPYVAAETPLDQVAFQFDIYVPEAWSESGYLKICLENGFNGGEWSNDCYNYVPWIVEKQVVPFSTTGWTTVTVPFTKFYAWADGESYTYQDVLDKRAKASYANFGFYFENSTFALKNITGVDTDETEFTSADTSVKVYTDNWRVVPLATPSYSDFPQ